MNALEHLIVIIHISMQFKFVFNTQEITSHHILNSYSIKYNTPYSLVAIKNKHLQSTFPAIQ